MSQRVIIGGASGLIGTALADALTARGDEVIRLVRRRSQGPGEIEWNPAVGKLAAEDLRGADAVVLLNGANVGRLPWTSAYKHELRSSRIDPTRTMADALIELGSDAPRLVSASAVGYYGSAPGEVLTEEAPAGDTFLARLCVEWEGEAKRAESVTRVALLRTPPVIDRNGVLKPMITLTNLFVGGPMGSQIWSWISLDDEVRAILHIIDNKLEGPFNLSAPSAASATDIGRALAHQLRKPFWLPVPGWGLRLLLGRDTADSLLLADANARPKALLDSGFEFTHADLESAVSDAMSGR